MLAFATPLPISNYQQPSPARRRASVVAVDRAILSIDVGTSATKAGLYFPDSRSLGPVYRHAHQTETKNGLITQRKQNWLDAAIATSRQAVSGDVEIIAFSITGQMQDLIAVGETPPLLTSDAILYSTSVSDEAVHLSKLANIDLAPTSIPAKLALLTPGNYRLLFGAADFVVYAFTSEKPVVTDATTASTTSLTCAPHRSYNRKLLSAVKHEDFLPLLPEIQKAPRVVGSLSKEVSDMIHGDLHGVPVIHAGGDAYTATIGAGGDYVYGGTSGWVGGTFIYDRALPSGVLMLAHAKEVDKVIAAGSVADVGGCVTHASRLLNCSVEELGRIAKRGRGGVVYVPYLSGRRCPPGKGCGAWVGLRTGDGKCEMARAVVEGIVYALYAAGGGIDVDDVVTVGGMISCDLFVQGVAAMFGGCRVGERDVGILGAGLVGAEIMGIRDVGESDGEWVLVDDVERERWMKGYERWVRIVGALEKVWD